MKSGFRFLSSAALLVALGVTISPAWSAVSQRGNLRVKFNGAMRPHRLPRTGRAPVAVSLAGSISTTDHSAPPQLNRIVIAINRHGRVDLRGLPRCRYHQIQPASTNEARRNCRSSLVGTGAFKANVALPEQSPFPSNGTILAFNGALHGKPVLYAHIYGTEPVPISRLIVFRIHHVSGTYGTVLSADLPRVAADWGYVSGLTLTLGRTFRHGGRIHGYLSAGCPAPSGFSAVPFSFARSTFNFEDGRIIHSSLTGTCKVRE